MTFRDCRSSCTTPVCGDRPDRVAAHLSEPADNGARPGDTIPALRRWHQITIEIICVTDLRVVLIDLYLQAGALLRVAGLLKLRLQLLLRGASFLFLTFVLSCWATQVRSSWPGGGFCTIPLEIRELAIGSRICDLNFLIVAIAVLYGMERLPAGNRKPASPPNRNQSRSASAATARPALPHSQRLLISGLGQIHGGHGDVPPSPERDAGRPPGRGRRADRRWISPRWPAFAAVPSIAGDRLRAGEPFAQSSGSRKWYKL